MLTGMMGLVQSALEEEGIPFCRIDGSTTASARAEVREWENFLSHLPLRMQCKKPLPSAIGMSEPKHVPYWATIRS